MTCMRTSRTDSPNLPERRANRRKEGLKIPSGRLARPEDVAAVEDSATGQFLRHVLPREAVAA